MQKNTAKKTAALVVVAALILIPLGSSALAAEYFEAESPGGGMMMYDFLVLRPLGIAATVVGSTFFVLSLPFSALGHNVDVASEKLVKSPARYTFSRSLGDF